MKGPGDRTDCPSTRSRSQVCNPDTHRLLLSLTGVLIADAGHIPRPMSISMYYSNPSYFSIPVPKPILAS